jgi:uncharacterized membrane protein YfcA
MREAHMPVLLSEGFAREACGLFATGLAAGGLNAVAGGGGFLTLPALLFCGLPPVVANATSSLAVWPGSLAGLFAYRRELKAGKHPLALFATIGAAGGLAGGVLLIASRNDVFMALLPYLLLLATALFAGGERLTARILAATGGKRVARSWVVALMLVIALYGGYFGGGMGIMTLAVLALMGMADIHEMNALKTYLVAIINGVCNALFVVVGIVDWQPCLALMAGCIIGGYLASRWARALDRTLVRRMVLGIASSMTVYFLVRAWWPA